MALIKCPHCGSEISDKAEKCVHCGQPLKSENPIDSQKTIICDDCGAQIEEGAEICSKCGCPVKNESEKETVNIIKIKDDKRKIKKPIIIGVSVAVILIAFAVVVFEATKDNESPVISNVPEQIQLHIGDDLNADEEFKDVYATDNKTEIPELSFDTGKLDTAVVGEYYVTITATDKKGNIATGETLVSVIDYPTHIAYQNAVNLHMYDLDVDSIGTYSYNGITISSDELVNIFGDKREYGDKLNQGAIYRSIARQLEGYYLFDDEFYSVWGESTVKTVWGIDKPDNKKDLWDYIEDTTVYVARKATLADIMDKLQGLTCTTGSFDYLNGEFSFTISDLTQAAAELKITEEMLGYILANIDEYAPETTFTANSYSCQLSFIKSDTDKSILTRNDFIYYENFNEEHDYYTELLGTDMFSYFCYDYIENIIGEDESEGIKYYTYRKLPIYGSYNSLLFLYGKGEEYNFNREDDIIYNVFEYYQSNDGGLEALNHCVKYVVYRYENNGKIVFYVDNNDKIALVLYTFSSEAY
ncbi:MAG: zinc-ribbon domain-containing protein [Clostridiales bacterium]|nr:zinc-ribbon domain-containing protein [Clostridiales bacterium]